MLVGGESVLILGRVDSLYHVHLCEENYDNVCVTLSSLKMTKKKSR